MSAGLEKKGRILEFRLSEAQYVSSLLQEASRLGLLSECELTRIRMELFQLLKNRVVRYTGGDSSSVRTETALCIMHSALFSIGVYLKSLSGAGECISMLKNSGMGELYQKSRPMLKKLVMDSKLLLKAVQKNRIDVDNFAYRDTIGNALPEFFRRYDVEFSAHETTASIDYPLCIDKMEKIGVEYISAYLKKLYYENLFCGRFSAEDIRGLLTGHDRNYRDLLINIFGLVLINALGAVLLDRSPYRIGLTDADRRQLMKKLGPLRKSELETLLKNAAIRLLGELNLKSGFLHGYITDALREISARLYNAVLNDRPEAVFVAFREDENENEIRFIDGARMDDKAFRKLAEEIRGLKGASDKMIIMKRRLRSFWDLADLLQADCIFGDEFPEVFRSLDEMQLALLMKRMPVDPCDKNIDLSECGDDWQVRYGSFLHSLGREPLQRIKELSEKIIL